MLDVLTKAPASHMQTGKMYGVVVGLVTNNQDPDGLGRVKVRFPWLADDQESHWARIATLMAGKDRGSFFLPEVDDEVLVVFEHGDVRFPYVIGALWNGVDTPPHANADGANNFRTIKSRSGHFIRLDDTDGGEQIEIIDSSGSNSIIIRTADNTITITADADITIQSNNGKLTMRGNGIEMMSQAGVNVDAAQDITLASQAGVSVEGMKIDQKASGPHTIKGAVVNIN